MQLAKWGNSLAVRIPSEIAKKLGWNEGDELDVQIGRNGVVEIVRPEPAVSTEILFERIDRLKGTMPADFKFDRDEANSRD
jgi:antitoxin MazE